MGDSIFARAAQFIRDRRDNKRWQAAVFCMAALVVGGTTWILVREAKAFSDSGGDVLDCRYEVHEHVKGCYDHDGERLVCGKVEYVVHTHDKDSCYDEDGRLVCQLREEKGHVHDAGCFAIEESLVCGLEESAEVSYMEGPSDEQEGSVVSYVQGTDPICGQEAHAHTGDCYVTGESTLVCGQEAQTGHSHTDDCYEVDEETGESTLTCGQEAQTGHSHTDDCYASGESTPACGMEEHVHSEGCYGYDSVVQDPVIDRNEPAGHTHSADCYSTVRRLICGKEGVHTHDGDCYLNGTLICTAPEVESLEEHEHGRECFAAGGDEDRIEIIYTDDDIMVTATFGPSAGISEKAVMEVEHIADKDDERYENCLAELEGTDGALADGEGLAMLLEFGFQTLDERFVPKDTVTLTVQFLNDDIYTEGDAVTVACFDEDGVALISGTDVDEDGVTTFDVDNLSQMAFIASVEKSDARDLVYECEDYIVTVSLAEDSEVPEDAELLVEEIAQEDSESYAEYFERLDEAGVLEDNETAALLFDMKIYAEDEEIVPDETMEVKVQFLNREIYFEGDAVKAANITADDIVLLETSDIDDELSTTFTMDEPAGVAFIVDGDIRTLTAEGEDYIVTVRFGPKALIPEDAKLVAERITEESDQEHFTAREDQLQEEIAGERVTLGALFRIGFCDADGEAIEPQSAVEIKIQLLDGSDVEKADSVKVAHFITDGESAEESIKIIEDADVTKDGDGSLSTSFQTKGFRTTEPQTTEPQATESQATEPQTTEE